MLLTYGTRGDNVTALQKKLNESGYGLAEDGIYGAKTQAAVRDYQTKNGLSADGIAGDLTWGKLSAAQTTQTEQTAQNTQTAQAAAPAKKDYSDWYTPSEQVEAYKAQLEALAGKKPGEFQSDNKAQYDALYDQIMGRKPFSYDLSADALYQQYKDQYQNLGQKAMEDTMGKAAALTGGYGSTYGEAVGQQQYNAYLQELNDKVPELYQLAASRYDQDGNDLLQKEQLAGNRYADDYAKYRDTVTDYQNEQSGLESKYQNERNFDYTTQSAGWERENSLTDAARSQAYTEAENLISAGIMPGDDLLQRSGMDKDYAGKMVSAYLAQIAASAAKSSGSSGRRSSGGSGSSSGSSSSDGLSSFERMQVTKGKATAATAKSRYTNRGNLWSDAEYSGFVQKLDMNRTTEGKRAAVADAYDEGKISDAQYAAICKRYGWSY